MDEVPPPDGEAALLPATTVASVVRPSAGASAAGLATAGVAKAGAGDTVPLLDFEQEAPPSDPSFVPQSQVAGGLDDAEADELPPQETIPQISKAAPPVSNAAGDSVFGDGGLTAARGPLAPRDNSPDLLDDLAESPTRVPMDPAEATPAIPMIPYTAPMAAAPSSPKYAVHFAPAGRSGGGGAAAGPWSRAEAFLGRPIKLPEVPADIASQLGSARWLFGQRRAQAALELLPVRLDADPSEVALLRLRCLVALRRYQEVGEELARATAALGDALPFEARVLAAQLPLFMSPADPLHAMGLLRELARQPQTKGEGVTLGERLHLLQRLSYAAQAACHSDVAAEEIRASAAEARSEDASELLVLLGRHHAAVGNIAAAMEAFEDAARAGRDQECASAHLDAGLLATAQGDHGGGSSHFRAAADAGAAAFSALRPPPDAHARAVDEVVSAETNLSVCQLYIKELREGVRRLEAFVKKDPVLHLRPCVLQALSALYEFLPDAQLRRAVLREVAEAFRFDDVEARALNQA